MDSISSASKALMEYISGPKSSVPLSSHKQRTVLEMTGVALTVPYLVKMVVTSTEAESVRDAAAVVITDVFREAEETFSPFVSSSELETKINKHHSTERIYVSPAMSDVLHICADLVEWSGGAFDPTCVPVGRWAVAATKAQLKSNPSTAVDLNGLERSSWFPNPTSEDVLCSSTEALTTELSDAVRSVVSSAEFAEKRRHTGWAGNVTLGDGWLQKRNPHTEMDISAVSKGWVVDRLFHRLVTEFGLLDLYVDWGGDIRSMGVKPLEDGPSSKTAPLTSLWAAGVLRPPSTPGGTSTGAPDTSCDAFVELPASGASLCTSGDYYQWCHLIDAVMPAPELGAATSASTQGEVPCSVSVMLAGLPCALCDGLSTALFLMLRRMSHMDVLRKLSEGLPRSLAAPTNDGADHSKNVIGALLVALRLPGGGLKKIDWTDVSKHVAGKSASTLQQASNDASGSAQLQRRLSMSSVLGGSSTSAPQHQGERSPLLDTLALRHLFHTIPRYVVILLLPLSRDGDGGKYYACAVSSFVQTSPLCATVFLEKGTASAALLDKHAASLATPRGDLLPIPPLVFSVAYIAPETLRRTVQGGTGMIEAVASGLILSQEDSLLHDAFHIASYEASVASPMMCVGDHYVLNGGWAKGGRSYSRTGEAAASKDGFHPGDYVKDNDVPTATCTLLMRLGKKYLSVAPPAQPGKWKLLPRARCVATVCIANKDTGKVEVCLGTVLTAMDITSRQPLLLTAFAPPGPLNALLFANRTPSSALPTASMITTVRLHVFKHLSYGDALLDWFKDVTCTDPGMQFMYHTTPSRTLTNASLHLESDARRPPTWVHDYQFSGGPQLGTLDTLVEDVMSPLDGSGHLLVLRPLVCKLDTGAALEGSCCSYGFL